MPVFALSCAERLLCLNCGHLCSFNNGLRLNYFRRFDLKVFGFALDRFRNLNHLNLRLWLDNVLGCDLIFLAAILNNSFQSLVNFRR